MAEMDRIIGRGRIVVIVWREAFITIAEGTLLINNNNYGVASPQCPLYYYGRRIRNRSGGHNYYGGEHPRRRFLFNLFR